MTSDPLRITIVGASAAGSALALEAAAAGHAVTLIDEHPQSLARMSFDAPYFYGTALPAALMNDNAIAQVVLEANPALMECFEAGIDVRPGAVVWGAFQNGPNSRHIGTPKVGVVTAGGNELIAHDRLVLATGLRDFVPAFVGSELPGVFGVKAGMAFLEIYQCYEGERTLVLGTSERAVAFVRAAQARGVEIVGMVEPGAEFAAGAVAAQEIAALGVPVLLNTVPIAAEGGAQVTAARLRQIAGGAEIPLACDSICVAIGALPNIELPAAMGCAMRFDEGIGSWVPETDAQGRTSLEGVLWVSPFSTAAVTLEALRDGAPSAAAEAAPGGLAPGAYLRAWIAALAESGGDDVILCKCEGITRGAFLGLAPPPYLGAQLRAPHTPVTGPAGDSAAAPQIQQDMLKRMTRVGMGHCQGKRCRDEAALLLSLRFGIGLPSIRPGSYRFPVRPVDLSAIAAEDDTPDTRDRWSYWLHAHAAH